jgi:2-succinyl-5-enolpyruvyl-6-hydroxy-3-cyclohexene-1-carboxylate synthase
MTAEHIAKQFDINYHKVSNTKELEDELEQFFKIEDNNRPSLLEVFTPRLSNDTILKAYFKVLKA